MSPREEKWIRDYLLGTLTEEGAQQLEERLLRDEEFAGQLLLVEDELIEDFARGALGARERERFEGHFLSTPRRRRKLMLVRGLRKYSSEAGAERVAARRPAAPSFFHSVLTPWWKYAALAVVLLAAGFGAWRVFFQRSDVERGLLALNDAYKAQRPLEARVTGLSYAPFSATRGGDDAGGPAQRARDRSAAILHDAAASDPSPAALHALGRVYLLQKEFDKAVAQFEEALKAAPDDARLHSDLGAALFEKGKLERLSDQSGRSEATLARGLEHLTKALELDDSLLDARFNRALLYQELRLTPQALQDWEKYVSQDPRSPWAEEARRNIEQIRAQQEKVSRREDELFREFLEAHRAGDQERVWRVFSRGHLRTGNAITNRLVDGYLASALAGRDGEAQNLSQMLTQLGQLSRQRADDLFTADVAQSYRSAAPGQLESLARARGLMREANELYNQSKNAQAIKLFAEAARLFEQSGDRPEALLADFWAGHCYSVQADTARSLSIFNDLTPHYERRGYKWLQSITRSGLANIRTRATQYSQAIEESWAAYELSSQAGDGNGMVRSLNTLASLHRSLGKYHQSLRLAQQGLRLADEVSADASQVIGLYATSAWSLRALGLYAAALEYGRHALGLGEAMRDPLVLSRYRVQMGLTQAKLKNYEEATSNIRLGIELGQRLGPEKMGVEIAVYARLYLGRTLRESGHSAEALDVLDEVVRFCDQNQQLWLLLEARKERLLTHIARGEVATARAELARVLADYEEQREKIREDSNRNSFFDKEQDIYDVALDFAHTHLSDPAQSFAYSEASRARSLLDASTAEWRLFDEAEVPYLRLSSARKPLALEELRRRLPERAQLLQYAALRDKLIIWYVSRERFESRAVAVGSDELAAKVARLRELISRPPRDDGRQLLRAAAELYDVLILPVAPLLERDRLLGLVPDKALHLLPFNVLFSPSAQRHLVEDFALVYAPSANMFVRDTGLAVEKGGRREERLLAVGNPRFDRELFPDLEDLPSAARETAEISALYGSHSLLNGEAARKSSVAAELRRGDVLHLATHYLPDTNSPMLSRLLLAAAGGPGQGRTAAGVLHAHELYRLRPARARLVVLAACRTGGEEYFRGEGAIGLSRPFKVAGVPLVLASLWPVDSEATTDLMINFHRLRRRDGLASAEALRAAQVQMLNHPHASYRRPYYWAPFALTGGHSDY